MALGPLMIDCEGTVLTDADRELLQDPLIGGVILFSRNYQSPQQITALCADIHAIRSDPPLLIAVDHEGGRVQRFRDGFVHLPAGARLGVYASQQDVEQAQTLAEQTGWLLGAELRAVGVDFSFTPVLDLDQGISSVIGDRALHQHTETVGQLATAMMHGLQRAGMIAVGKHFPGHGGVSADSHHDLPLDLRDLNTLREADLIPFKHLIEAGLPAIMTAHVVYEKMDAQPASFSEFWLQTILREELGFKGIIFSDDLSMKGACGVGDMGARAHKALAAGCDMLLICNDRAAVLETLPHLRGYHNPSAQVRLARLAGKPAPNWNSLHRSEAFQTTQQALLQLETYA